jgi:hypothetical protein
VLCCVLCYWELGTVKYSRCKCVNVKWVVSREVSGVCKESDETMMIDDAGLGSCCDGLAPTLLGSVVHRFTPILVSRCSSENNNYDMR